MFTGAEDVVQHLVSDRLRIIGEHSGDHDLVIRPPVASVRAAPIVEFEGTDDFVPPYSLEIRRSTRAALDLLPQRTMRCRGLEGHDSYDGLRPERGRARGCAVDDEYSAQPGLAMATSRLAQAQEGPSRSHHGSLRPWPGGDSTTGAIEASESRPLVSDRTPVTLLLGPRRSAMREACDECTAARCGRN